MRSPCQRCALAWFGEGSAAQNSGRAGEVEPLNIDLGVPRRGRGVGGVKSLRRRRRHEPASQRERFRGERKESSDV